MTKTNEFYLSKEGKACHMNFETSPKFLSLGATFIASSKSFFINMIESRFILKAFYKNADQFSVKFNSKNIKYGILGIAVSAAGFTLLNHHLSPTVSNALELPIQNHVVEKEKAKFLPSLFDSKKEAFTNLLIVTEGKSNTFYKDNSGIAVGYGWNPTKNTKAFNLEIAKEIGLNPKEQKAIEAISANNKVQSVPKSLKQISFTDHQLQKSVKVMMRSYEKEFLNVLKLKSNESNYDFEKFKNKYFALPYNQQAVLLHMTYKVGAKNLIKYNNFFEALFVYLDNPTKSNLKETSTHFEYSYKARDGELKRDTKVEKKHVHFFNNCLKEKIKILDNLKSCRIVSIDTSKPISLKNG